MSERANEKVREAIRKSPFYQYQVAQEMGVSEVTFIRWLRSPLSPEKESAVHRAIKRLEKERETA